MGFTGLNILAKIQVLSSDTPEGLIEQLGEINLPVQLKGIYGMNGKHYAWILTDAKIVKKKKEPQNGRSSKTR